MEICGLYLATVVLVAICVLLVMLILMALLAVGILGTVLFLGAYCGVGVKERVDSFRYR